MTCKADIYALARYREGLSDAEAGERAGYASETPSRARALWRAMESMARAKGEWCDPSHYEDRVAALSAQLSEARLLLRASELLQSSEETG